MEFISVPVVPTSDMPARNIVGGGLQYVRLDKDAFENFTRQNPRWAIVATGAMPQDSGAPTKLTGTPDALKLAFEKHKHNSMKQIF